jgi:DNA-directed RNA polymerase specialized sigma24 family protein
MVAAQRGEKREYEQLLRELDGWLRSYYARRLPPLAAEDVPQEALLANHANRHTYLPTRPFGPWVAAIARYKWVDHLREASRTAALSLDEGILGNDHVEPALSTVAVVELLRRLKPAQATVIRLVKLGGVTIEGASKATLPSPTAAALLIGAYSKVRHFSDASFVLPGLAGVLGCDVIRQVGRERLVRSGRGS